MVGATTALALADLGLKVAIIDKFAPQDFSSEQVYDLRVSAISLASQYLLEQLNIWPQLQQWRLCPYQRLGVGEQALAYTEFHSEELKQPYLGHIIENRLIQLSAWQQLKLRSNITLLCPDELLAVNTHADGVELTLSSCKLQTKLLLGADGANSSVRKLTNIGTTGWQYGQSAMLIHVETEYKQQDITWQQFFETGPVAMLPLSGKQASLVWYHNPNEIARLSKLSNTQLTEEIHQVFPKKLGKISVINKASFPLTRRHANQYVKPHIALLGDAAHTINPLAGQGVNIGFKDVKALQMTFAKAIGEGRDWSSFEVLKEYEQARRADNLLMMTGMDVIYQAFSHPSKIVKALRNIAIFGAGKTPVLKEKMLAYACGL